ncbi:unnamed protein product [Cyprideis torosa]|uniref:Uncharacterized protein n=1 Tax=Cyprideis torosa TaxID=163714 RepID=A0A7R8WBD5_9CRUS|nr:unnamed protein product [Cyprideis torosa]CAG0890760.1 unnamed protein product [Cyprideis torosa]
MRDLTIYDAANATAPVGRLKKSSVGGNEKELRERAVKEETLVPDCWMDDPDLVVSPGELEEDGTAEATEGKKLKRKKTVMTTTVVVDEGITRKSYPVEVWFLIAEFIDPEDVGTFAAICGTTASIVRSTGFWINLYKRWYHEAEASARDSLPTRLRPVFMQTRMGLRARVIRSLFFLHPRFIARSMPTGDTIPLLGSLCTLMWLQKIGAKSHYYFKLERVIQGPHSSSSQRDELMLNDENNCQILEVISRQYNSLPMVMGLYLVSIKSSVSHGASPFADASISNRCTFIFSTLPQRIRNANQGCRGGRVVTLDGVITTRVHPWWLPSYPLYNQHTRKD